MRRRWPTLLRGLLAAAALAALIGGMPILLVREVGWPLPTTVPAWEHVTGTLATGTIEDATIIKTLAVLVWLTWANFTSGVAIEIAALARGRAAHRITGLRSAQHLAANLLATISIALATLSRPAAIPAADAGELRLAVAAAQHQSPQLADLPRLDNVAASSWGVAVTGTADTARADQHDPSGGSRHLYQVRRGDTLWDLATRFLGDGMRWQEIRDLNVGRAQPDGSRMTAHSEDLRPGWTLVIPGGTLMPAVAEGSASAARTETVTVEPGDTLWEIADEHLDNPHRWPDVYEDNRAIRQPDGNTLHDPDLIQPGWIIDLPDATATDRPAEADTSPDTTEPDAPPQPPQDAAETPDPLDRSAQLGRDRTERRETFPHAETKAATEPPLQRQAPPAVPSASPPASPSNTTSDGQPANSVAGDESDDLDVAVVTSAAATAAAGLILALDRIRRARRRRREPQHRIPLPNGDAERTEHHLRDLADGDTAQFVDLVLRELAGSYAPHRPIPPVVLVSYDTDDLAVHLDTATEPSPDGWDAHDDALTWSRPRPADLDSLQRHRGTPSRLPVLVTLGTLTSGRIAMLNLAHSHCLHLDGEPDRAEQLLRAWALELATTARADTLDVITIGLGDLPADLERLDILDDAQQLRDRLGQPRGNGSTHTPTTVILAAELPDDLAILLRTTAELHPDVVAVTNAPPRNGNWTLQLDGDHARLRPEDISVRLPDLAEETMPAARLLHQALHDPDELVPIPESSDADTPADIDLNADTAQPADTESDVEVRILGPVEIASATEPFRTNKTIELIVYLALHRSGADTDTLMEALWPGQQPRVARLYTEASRARKALGVAADGAPYLPDAELGRYRLSPAVTLDHERLTAAVAAARECPDRAEQHLRHALALIRGMPLSATATDYAWATNTRYRLAEEVVDVAHHLAQLYLDNSRYDDAVWAAEQGLLADPIAEILVRDLMQAADVAGNTAGVHASMARLRSQLTDDGDANDADDWLHPDTLALYEALTRPTVPRAGTSSAHSI